MEGEPSFFALASTWQVIAAVAAIWAVLATFAAPWINARLTENWQQRQERRRLKLWVFGTLMQDRGGPISNDAVRAYNLIDALFHDGRKVRDAWGEYYDSLGDGRLGTGEGARIREDKRNALLRTMAEEIGLGDHFVSQDFTRVYRPMGMAEQDEINHMQQQLLKKELSERLTSDRQDTPKPDN